MDYISYKDFVWNTCLSMFKEGVEKGLEFIAQGKCDEFGNTLPDREEIAVNSRYLHRGFYCPSPVFHLYVANARRGKLLSRPTSRSKITHRYFYNTKNELYRVEYYSEKLTNCEYIWTENDVRYGFVLNFAGILGGISVERYEAGKLQSYMWATCHNASSVSDDWQADYCRYETYTYDESGVSNVDIHFVALIEEEHQKAEDALSLVNHKKYHCVYDKNLLIDIERTE